MRSPAEVRSRSIASKRWGLPHIVWGLLISMGVYVFGAGLLVTISLIISMPGGPLFLVFSSPLLGAWMCMTNHRREEWGGYDP
jgi:hypothetical protein